MTKAKIRTLITKFHFYLLGIALLNFVLKSGIELSLNYKLSFLITLLIYISGIILFLWNFRPFKKIAIYFSVYFITPIFAILFWIFGGIFFGLIVSIVLYPIQPNKLKIEDKNILIYEKAQGFLGPCCPYIITEKQYIVLEKKIKEINLYDQITLDNSSIRNQNGRTELKVSFDEYEFYEPNTTKKDTIILIKTE